MSSHTLKMGREEGEGGPWPGHLCSRHYQGQMLICNGLFFLDDSLVVGGKKLEVVLSAVNTQRDPKQVIPTF